MGSVTFEYTASIAVQSSVTDNPGVVQDLLAQLTDVASDPASLTSEFVDKYTQKKKDATPDWIEPEWVKTVAIQAFTVPEELEITDSKGTQQTLTKEAIETLVQDLEEDVGALGQFPGLLVSSILLSITFFHLG